MTCAIFGQENFPPEAAREFANVMYILIYRLINVFGFTKFYVDNDGDFSHMAQTTLAKFSSERPDLELRILLSRKDEQPITEKGLIAYYLPEYDNYPKKSAISKRNEWLLEHANLILTYVDSNDDECMRWIEKAMALKKTVLNLADGISYLSFL